MRQTIEDDNNEDIIENLDEFQEDLEELAESQELDNEEIQLTTEEVYIPIKKINYVNNKDLLKEIHKSKCSFSEFIDPKYSTYDVIVEKLEDIFLPEIQEQGRITKASRLTNLAYEEALTIPMLKVKPKLSEYKVTSDTIDTNELVYRVLTYEHIPLAPGRKKNPKTVGDKHAKLNFHPFKHYIIEDGIAKEVGRSHSKKGQFSVEHGSITNKLANMLIMLVEKYSQKSNWRSYCVDDQTLALTKRGWLSQQELTTDDTILSYNEGRLVWSSIKSIYRGHYTGKMHYLTNKHGFNSLITPNHKLVTGNGIKPVELVTMEDKIIMLGDAVIESENKIYSDAFVELAAWVSTEGTYEKDQLGRLKRICISQNRGPKAERIRECLQKLNYKFSCNENRHTNLNIGFAIHRACAREFEKLLPHKFLPIEFIMNLTTDQRELFLNTLIDGDGWRTGDNKQHLRYCQKNKQHVENFQLLCALTGRRSQAHYVPEHLSFGKLIDYYTINIFSKRKNTSNCECIDFNGGWNTGKNMDKIQLGRGKINHPNIPTIDYDGIVWCPETEYGSFVVKRNNNVYFTGNSYLEEMKGSALLQLAQMMLQFDEHKSDNPFAYATTIASTSFTRVLNLEKRNQDLRDDLLIDNGASPSFSRQMAVENEVRRLREEAQYNKDDI